MIWLYVVLLLLFIYALKHFITQAGGNSPPGPAGLPLIGNVHQVNFEDIHLTFDKWKQEYGDIVGAKFFTSRVTVLNSLEVIKDAMVKQGDNFSARPELYTFRDLAGGVEAGIVNSNGQIWKEQRRHTLHVLRDFGIGRSVMEEKIADEAVAICQVFEDMMKRNPSAGIDVQLPLKVTVANIITNVLFSHRFEHDGDERFEDITRRVAENFVNIRTNAILDFFPVVRFVGFLFGINETFKKSHENIAEVHKFFNEQVAEHKKSLDDDISSGPPSDYVYAYLLEMQKRAKESSPEAKSYNEHMLRWILSDLFVAGFETTATTMAWFVAYMVHHPEVLRKMQEEIEGAVGGTTPGWADRQRLPYCNAVISEVQRCGNVAPTALFHSCYKDAELNGYTIPKGSFVIMNLFSLHRDPKHFQNPLSFQPERFLDANGQFIDKTEGLLPFSIGKRQCPGEGLARMELFMLTTAIALKFNIKPASNGKPDLEPVSGLTLGPKPFKAVMEKRS